MRASLGLAALAFSFAWKTATSGLGREGTRAGAQANNSGRLHACELSYVQMDSSLVKFSVSYLERERAPPAPAAAGLWSWWRAVPPGPSPGPGPGTGTGPCLAEIEPGWPAEQLASATQLDASRPFVFFINGFNALAPDAPLNATWMFDVARNFAAAGGRERNVVFLTWSIPDLFASNPLAMIPAYYKTVANYELIAGLVARALAKLVAFVDARRAFGSQRARADYFGAWHFYGHSLGSHILADAIARVAASAAGDNEQPPLKFGKLVGLDPATPCFSASRHLGISSAKLARAVRELLVLHSNAGLAGVPSKRAHVEIVLNGGTFQPGCAWYDFACHHARSTDVLSYADDACQMVAYACSSYHHFKLGACETCAPGGGGGDGGGGPPLAFGPAGAARNCVLVNLPEQHRDSRALLERAERLHDERRQLAEANQPANSGRLRAASERAPPPPLPPPPRKAADDDDGAARRPHHFVNTSPNFRVGRRSHCLQHYQLRLLICGANESAPAGARPLGDKCKLSSFYVAPADEITLKLFHEDDDEPADREPADRERLRVGRPEPRQPANSVKLNGVKLNGVIKDLFHTALVNLEGRPRLFTGAQLGNIELGALGECARREAAARLANATATTGGRVLNFVLDIAFMSHTNFRIRNAFSSVLCGQLDLAAAAAVAAARGDALTLSLCRRSELRDVSSQIDTLLAHMRLHRLDDTWKVSLLNSLFSLFTEWEPF